MTDTVRLSKHLAALLPCSRREAELYIEGGWVTVDGLVVEEPQFKVGSQQVSLLPGALPEELPPVTLLFNKPAGMSVDEALASLGPDNHASGDNSPIKPRRKHFRGQEALLPLATEAAGLLVFSQDWRVKRKLEEDGARLEQELILEVAGREQAKPLDTLGPELRWGRQSVRQFKLSWQSEQRLRLALKNPPPGLEAFICAQLGLGLLGTRRLRLGQVPLAGLPLGEWRDLGNERF